MFQVELQAVEMIALTQCRQIRDCHAARRHRKHAMDDRLKLGS
jgi:hypothetical protein